MAIYLAQVFDHHVAAMGTKDKDRPVVLQSLVTPFVDAMKEQAGFKLDYSYINSQKQFY